MKWSIGILAYFQEKYLMDVELKNDITKKQPH